MSLLVTLMLSSAFYRDPTHADSLKLRCLTPSTKDFRRLAAEELPWLKSTLPDTSILGCLPLTEGLRCLTSEELQKVKHTPSETLMLNCSCLSTAGFSCLSVEGSHWHKSTSFNTFILSCLSSSTSSELSRLLALFPKRSLSAEDLRWLKSTLPDTLVSYCLSSSTEGLPCIPVARLRRDEPTLLSCVSLQTSSRLCVLFQGGSAKMFCWSNSSVQPRRYLLAASLPAGGCAWCGLKPAVERWRLQPRPEPAPQPPGYKDSDYLTISGEIDSSEYS